MLTRNQQIRVDKQNKIKLLLSEFQLCKQKIFQHKQERREQEQLQYQSRKHQSVSRNPNSHSSHPQQPSSSIRKKTQKDREKEQEQSYLFKKRIHKLQEELKQKAALLQYQEEEYTRLLSEERESNKRLEEELEGMGQRVQEQVCQYFVREFQDQLERMSVDGRVAERLEYYEEKLRCLGLLLEEVRRGYKFNEEGFRMQMQDVVREKIELELLCEEYKEKLREKEQGNEKQQIEGLRRKVIELQQDNKVKQLTLSSLQKQFREQIKQYMKKIDDISRATTISKTSQHQLELLKLQYQTELKNLLEESNEYQSQIELYKSKIQRVEGEIYSNELNHQKEIEKMHLEIKKLNQNMVKLEDQHGKKCEEFDQLKGVYEGVQKMLEKSERASDEMRRLCDGMKQQIKEGVMKLGLANDEIGRLKEEREKESKRRPASVEKSTEKIQQMTHQKQINSLKKQVQSYKSEISELKIVLEFTNQQLNSLKAIQNKKMIETPPSKAQRGQDKQKQIELLKEQNRQLQMKILDYQSEIQQFKKQVHKFKEREIGSQKQIEEKQHMIEELRERKVGFQNLFIEMESSNEKLNCINGNNSDTIKQQKQKGKEKVEEEHRQKITNTVTTIKPIIKPSQIQGKQKKRVENHIKSSIKDLDIRLIDSDPEETVSHEDKLQEIREVEFKSELDEVEGSQQHRFNPNMHYSFNPANKQKLMFESKIKELQSEVDLLKSQNQTLSKKKQTMQEQLVELESREEYFIEQKQRMKGELATYLTEINTTKQLIKKFLSYLTIESKGMIKTSFDTIKRAIFDLVKIASDGSQFQKQLTEVIERKKGFFSIL